MSLLFTALFLLASQTRYFDQQLFATEMRLGRVQKQLSDATMLINEARTGVGHLIAMLLVNEPMLQALPHVPVPVLTNNEDVAKCLAWWVPRLLWVIFR